MLQNRPLYDNKADAPLFVEPESWEPLKRALDRSLNILVRGDRGTGKTTLMRQLQLDLRSRGETAYFVDATALPDLPELVMRIRDASVGTPSPVSETAQQLASIGRAGPKRRTVGVSREVHAMLDAVAGAPSGVFLVDASGSGEALFELFGRLRDVLWQQHHVWIVAIGPSDRPSLMRPPADAFFDVELVIDPLPSKDLAELLSRRTADISQSTTRQLVKAAEGNPRAAIRALNDFLVNQRDPNVEAKRRGKLIDAASGLGRTQAMLMAELLERGQASPSDTELQMSLGLTRARLTTHLRDLLANNLVTAESVRSDGPGRPRTVYRPRLPK